MGLEVEPLLDRIAPRRDGRKRQDDGFGPQVKPGPGIGRVVVRRDDIRIGGRGRAGVVADLVEAADIAREGGVDRLGVHRPAALQRRIGVKPGLGRDGAGLVRGEVLGPGRAVQAKQDHKDQCGTAETV